MLKVFWDLDGTLVDNRLRLYELFCRLSVTCNLSFDEYWTYKYRGYNQDKMLKLVGYRQDEDRSFQHRWLMEIEKEEYLAKDTLQRDVSEVLNRLSQYGFLQWVVTNRQLLKNAEEELKKLGIHHFFEGIWTTAFKCKKSEIIQEHCNISASDFYIGDSAEDIKTAKELGIHSIAVCTDPSLEESLRICQPEWIVYNRMQILEIIKG